MSRWLLFDQSSPLEIFLIPGQWALKLILVFFQISAHSVQLGLATVFAFLLALLFWCWLLSLTITIIKRLFGFHAPRGRQ
jgi:hypothetical protein